MLQLFGMSLDDVLSMLLDGGSYFEDDAFNDLRSAIRNEEYDRLRILLVKIDEKKLIGKGLYRQLYLYAKVLIEPNLNVPIAIDRMIEALRITKQDFSLDRISEYRLRFDELMIVNEMGRRLLSANEFGNAAKVFEDAAKSMDTYYLNERLKCEMYPDFLSNLSSCYGGLGRYREAEAASQTAKTLAIRYGKLRSLPYLLNNIGMARLMQGDRNGCLHMTIQAYFSALAMGKQAFAEQIKTDAENDLGIDLSIIDQLLLESSDSNRPKRGLPPEIG
jgi:tetratricopeptide (TPR) repeat protein